MNLDELKTSLQANKIQPQEIVPLKGRGMSYSYLLKVSKDVAINDVKKVDSLDNLKVSWERYARRSDYTQCYNCQRFGHGQQNCYNQSRCVKCPGAHHYRECPLVKTQTSKVFCCNCKGEHTANYSQCPTLLDYLQNKNKNSKTNNSQSPQQNKSRPPTSFVQNNKTFASTVRSSENNDLPTLLNMLSNDNSDISDVINLLKLIIDLKTELSQVTSPIQKLAILSKFLEKF